MRTIVLNSFWLMLRNSTHQHDEASNVDIVFAIAKESNIGKEQVKRIWNDDEKIPQCFVFLVDGFGTTLIVLSIQLYDLAFDQHIQQNLQIFEDRIHRSNDHKSKMHERL